MNKVSNSKTMNRRKGVIIISVLVSLVSAPIVLYMFLIWYVFDFSPYAFQADRCMDRGGCWDEIDNVCRKDEPNAQELCQRGKAKK